MIDDGKFQMNTRYWHLMDTIETINVYTDSKKVHLIGNQKYLRKNEI